MHPYYGSDRLVSASPTPIESVDADPPALTATNNTMSNNGITTSPLNPGLMTLSDSGAAGMMDSVLPQVSGLGMMGSQFPLSHHQHAYQTNQYQPTALVSHSQLAHAPVLGVSPQNIYSSNNGYSAPPFHPVATSTPFVKFATPSTSTESVYSHTNKVHYPRVSPTFSTPPIQMVAPQAGSVLWQHNIPTSMPWVNVGSPTSVKFTASTSSHTSTRTSHSSARKIVKRKSTFDDHVLPEKVHVNEEKMAERLNSLHLDNNNLQWHPDLEDQWYSQKPNRKNKDDKKDNPTPVDDLAQGLDETQLNFSELLKIGIKSQDILPKIIMEEINKPCMQVVLWKPPGNFMQEAVRERYRGRTSPNVTTEMIDMSNGDSLDIMVDSLPTPISSPRPSFCKTPVRTTESSAMDAMEL